jgi:hypothetical protein
MWGHCPHTPITRKSELGKLLESYHLMLLMDKEIDYGNLWDRLGDNSV